MIPDPREATLPQSPEAERALLGSLLFNPESIHGLHLDAGDFYIIRNREVFSAMQRLSASHTSLDYLTLTEELRKVDKLADIGGEGYLMQLLTDTPSSLHGADYADIIREQAQRRRVVQAATILVQSALNPKANLQEAIATAASAIVASAQSQDGARAISEVIAELWDAVEEASKNPREIFGIPTGLAGFDRITSGLQRGEVFMLSGEPGVGKSFLAMQFGVGAAEGSNGITGTPGAVFELEMSAIATVRRSLSVRSRVPARSLRTGNIGADDWTRLAAAVEHMGRLPIYISDRTDWTSTGIRAECARLKTHGIGWIIIDYLALLKDSPDVDEVERSGLISDRVHDIAKDLDLAVIAIHDMTKAGMTGMHTGQAGLSGSRRVSYNADMTAFLRKTDQPDIFNLEWAKFREDTPDRYLPLRRVPGFPAYAEVAN
jgi:replicative DNA helicase